LLHISLMCCCQPYLRMAGNAYGNKPAWRWHDDPHWRYCLYSERLHYRDGGANLEKPGLWQQ